MCELLDNIEKLQDDSDEWSDYTQHVVTFVMTHFTQWTQAEVHRAIGILRTNAYCVEAGDSKTHALIRIIYPNLSMM